MLDGVLMACVTVPNHWTLRLAVEVLDGVVEGEAGLRVRYEGPIVKAMREHNIVYTGTKHATIRALAAVVV